MQKKTSDAMWQENDKIEDPFTWLLQGLLKWKYMYIII